MYNECNRLNGMKGSEDVHVQALIVNDCTNEVLMVNQYTYRRSVIWTLPGGSVEEGETYREAVVREVLEETGLNVDVGRILLDEMNRVVYEAVIVGGDLYLDKSLDVNDEILEVSWKPLDDLSLWNDYMRPVWDRYKSGTYGRCVG